jgi:hypothetical protein
VAFKWNQKLGGTAVTLNEIVPKTLQASVHLCFKLDVLDQPAPMEAGFVLTTARRASRKSACSQAADYPV